MIINIRDLIYTMGSMNVYREFHVTIEKLTTHT